MENVQLGLAMTNEIQDDCRPETGDTYGMLKSCYTQFPCSWLLTVQCGIVHG